MIFLDFETRSRADLTSVGGHNYCVDPTTEIVCLAAATDDGQQAWVVTPFPGPLGHLGEPLGLDDCDLEESCDAVDLPESLLAEIRRDPRVVAHNAEGFDRPLWRSFGFPEVEWLDSLPRARRAGLPGKLEQLTQLLYGTGKDKAGRRVMLGLSKPVALSRAAVDGAVRAARSAMADDLMVDRAGERTLRMILGPSPSAEALASVVAAPPYGVEVLRDPDPAQLTEVIRYCLLDVALLRAAWLDEGLGDPHPDDPVLEVDTAINRRGMPVDLELTRALLAEAEKVTTDAGRRAAEATAGEVTESTLRSTAELRAWLRRHKIDLPDVKADTVRAVLAERAATSPLTAVADPVSIVLAARLDVARVATGKLRALLSRTCSDGRLRGALAYHQAHTGRWAGRGVQVQNLPRPPKGMRDDLADALVGDLPSAFDPPPSPLPAEWVGGLIRQCFAAPEGRLLVVYDYSQIEARALLWLAGDLEGLDVFRSGRDPYRVAAGALFNVDPESIPKDDVRRQVGKVMELGAGFGAGPDSIERVAKKSGVDPEAAGTSPVAMVESWRARHPKIAGYPVPDARVWTDDQGRERIARRGGWWRALERGARCAVTGAPEPDSPWRYDGCDLWYRLPSGRELRYRDARVEEVEKHGKRKPGLTFYSAERRCRVDTWGARLAENAVQAFCRDLLAAALVEIERRGWEREAWPGEGPGVVSHVHDEVVLEVVADAWTPETRANLERILTTPPAWAAGFPIAVEGHAARRYTK